MYNPDFDIYLDGENTFVEFNLNGGTRGIQGEKGDTGDDGYSPTVDVSKEGKVATITITDVNGTHIVQISDGIGDMEKSIYDTDGDGKVDSAEDSDTVNGHTVEKDIPSDAVFTDTTYTAGTGISIENDTIINTKTKTSDLTNDSGFITKEVNNLTYYTLKENTGSLVDLEVNTSTYVVTLTLKDVDGNTISTDTIDLPLESVVVSGSFDSVNKKIVLTLQNGNTVDIPVGDLVAGLQTEITSTNKIASDYVDDTNSGNKFVTTTEKNTWNAKLDSSDLTNYVKNTDYASNSTGGVIKTGSNAISINGGFLVADTRTYSNYTSAGNGIFISKGTLENVITGKDLTTKSYVDGLVGDINSVLDTINGEVI